MIQKGFIKSVGLGLITATIFCAQSAMAGTVFGYHWQNAEGNRELLEAAGLNPDRINLEELNVQNASITPNGRFFELIRKWYSKNKPDAAGAGFYFSSDPLDTFEQGYGNDLLIVELNLRDTSTLDQFKHQSGFKKISDAAIEDGKEGKLPIISRVYSDFGWYVITRPSNLTKVQITIRKPSPKDVGVIYESWKKRSDFLSIMVRLAKIVTDPKKTLSVQSRIVFHRILFDHFTKDLDKYIPRLMGDNGSITSIERAFRQFLPGDSRLGLLFQAKLKHLISLGVKEDVLALLRKSTNVELKSAEVLVKKYFFTQMSIGETKPLDLLKLLPVFSQKLTAAEKSKIKAWFKQKSKSELIELMLLAPGSANALYSLDPNYIRPLLPDLLKQIFKRIDEWQRLNKATPHSSVADERADKIRVAYRTFVSVIAEFSDINPQFSDVWLAAAFSKHSNKPSTLSATILDPLLNEIYLSGRTNLKSILQKYLSPFLEKHKLYSSFAIIDIRKIPDEKKLKSILFTFATDFPAFGSQVMRSLQDQSKNYGLINRAEFSKQIEGQLPIMTLEEKFQEIVQSIQESSPLLISKISVSQVTQFMRNAWIQIPNHQEFNDVVKSMVLIDSALLSEDLRRMSATQPWKRFNEQFIHDDGTTDYQPAWENFLTGWTLLTKNLKNRAYVWNDDIRSDSMSNLSPLTYAVLNLTQEIENAHSQMISSGVDGSSHLSTQAKYYLNDWDRKKYQNDMSVSQLAFLGASADLEMAKQFYIFEEDSNGDLKYRFADISELVEINPAFRNFLKNDRVKDLSHAGPNELMSFLAWTIYNEKDPVRRAAKILHLVPKIHPNENGNGRLARTWAAVEITASGYPIPIAFQTNDFLMNEERIYWELRRSMALGKIWESMVKALSAKGVPVNDLFQKHYKGSFLEGLTLLRPTSQADLKSLVNLLESDGSKEFASDAQELFNEKMLLDGRRQVNQLNELQQAIIFEEIWQIIKQKNPQAFFSVALPRQCSAVFAQ